MVSNIFEFIINLFQYIPIISSVILLNCYYDQSILNIFDQEDFDKMLVRSQIKQFLQVNHKKKIIGQIPDSYEPEQALLNLLLNINLLQVFKDNREMAVFIVSNYPLFYSQCVSALEQIIVSEGLQSPEHGLHLIINIQNCPLPVKNISSTEFLSAALEQKDGIMAYFNSATVLEISQPEIYLFTATQIWIPICSCISIQNSLKKRKISKNLIEVVRNSQFFNGNNSLKNKSVCEIHPDYLCQLCEKPYKFLELQDEIYLNCEKIRLMIPKNVDSLQQMKYSIFSSHQLIVYAENNNGSNFKVGDQISCCCYIFCKQIPLKTSISVNSQLLAKPVLKTYMISSFRLKNEKQDNKKPLLFTNSQNNQFFNELISQTNLSFEPCEKLSDYDLILKNYNMLIGQINRVKFPYLMENTLTTLKLSILNSIFSHYCLNNNLHLLIMVEEIQIILRAFGLKNLILKFWPSDYDQSTLKAWLLAVKGSIVVVSNPNKKDLKILQRFIGNQEQSGTNNLEITFWVVSQNSFKKDFNLNSFAIVLDLTYEKNRHICKSVLDETIDMRLSAFITEPAEQNQIYTIHRVKNAQARIYLTDTIKRQSKLKLDKVYVSNQQHQIAKQIIQKYYLKCRELKKTPNNSLNYLLKLAQGFSSMVSFMSLKKTEIKIKSPKLSLLDAVLAIFLDEESSRHKYSGSNTIFGTDVSKLILNEKECEISFWDYECEEDGVMKEIKNYMSKDQMMKRMLYRLHELLYEDQLLLLDDF